MNVVWIMMVLSLNTGVERETLMRYETLYDCVNDLPNFSHNGEVARCLASRTPTP